MNLNKKIFKAYDIRGIYPGELNEEIAYAIGRAYGVLRKGELNPDQEINIVVGHDMRLSSPEIFNAVKRGLIDQGLNVVDIGLTSTPTYYFAVANYGYDGGLLVSASHNPKEYNGMKITRDRARPLGSGTGMEQLADLVEKGEFLESEKKGQVIPREGVLVDQVQNDLKYAKADSIKPMKIVLDPANAMGITYLTELFKHLPQIELVKMNYELDGTFPAHIADPFVLENTADLREKVKAENADLGIATDGDGDRIFFIDNQGELVDPAIVRGIMAKLFLRDNPGATICYDIRPGKITKDMILEGGGTPSVTKVGHSLIKQQMIETGAVFGGESSGHFFVRFPHGIYEAPMVVALKLMQELSETGQTLAEYIAPLKRYTHSGEINFKITDKDMVLNRLKEKYADAEISNLDGLTFSYPHFWFNVRGSNTEPLLRLNLEAVDQQTMEEKKNEIKQLIEG